MNNETQSISSTIGESIVKKFVNEEIMTKSEFSHQLNVVMDKYTKHIDDKFAQMDSKFSEKFAQVDDKFAQMDNKFSEKFAYMNDKLVQMDKRIDHIDNRYTWVMGIIIASTVSIIGMFAHFH